MECSGHTWRRGFTLGINFTPKRGGETRGRSGALHPWLAKSSGKRGGRDGLGGAGLGEAFPSLIRALLSGTQSTGGSERRQRARRTE